MKNSSIRISKIINQNRRNITKLPSTNFKIDVKIYSRGGAEEGQGNNGNVKALIIHTKQQKQES